MIPYERQEKILDILNEKKFIKIEELSNFFIDVSVSTLRRDIKELEKTGKVEWMYGGAIKRLANTDELPIDKKLMIRKSDKNKIASLAIEQVIDGETIYVDSGSTATLILEGLMNKNITIYTTNTIIFNKILSETHAEIVVLGGTYNPVTSSLSGSLTENNLRNIFFDKSFIGVNGIDIKNGVTTPNFVEAVKKRLIHEHSKSTYLLCDSGKFGLTANIKAFDVNGTTIISDKRDEKLAKVARFVVSQNNER